MDSTLGSRELMPVTTPVGLFDMSTPGANDTWWTDLIHPYWRQFEVDQYADFWHYIVAVWMTFFGILGVLGNFLVIWIFTRTKSLRTPPNMLVVNLAIGDMAFAAINGFPLLTISSLNKKWVWGKTWCEIYGFIGGLFGFMSINTLAWIAYDRYNVITKPLQAAKRLSHKRAFMYIVLVWVWSLLWALPPFFGWGAYIPEGLQTSCTFDYLTQDTNNISYVSCIYICGFLMPLMIIVYCYYNIVQAVMKHHREMTKTAERMGAKMSKQDQDKKQELQTAKIAATTVGSFLLSWVPYAIVGFFGMITPHSRLLITPLLSEIPVMFAKASAAYNPIIYALSHPRFRAQLNKHCPWLLCCCKPEKERDSSFSHSHSKKVGRENSSVTSNVSDSAYTSTMEMAASTTTIATVGSAAPAPGQETTTANPTA